jgi:O-antigen/teichoic acid export membrane protein
MLLALAVRLVEMAGDLGIERLAVQAPDGATCRFQAEMHGAALLRGAVLALILLAAAPLLAAAFPDGPTAGAYAALALAPLIRGAVHLDTRRNERGFRFGRTAIVECGATFAMLAALAPALALFGDHRAMAAVLVAQAATGTALSHVVATRRYRVAFSTAALTRLRRFGTPLVANAALLFLTFYADRLIVAAHFDLATLAVYGVALQLALLPAQIVGRAAASLLVPRFRLALSEGAIGSAARAAVGSHLGMACAFAIAFVVLAPQVIGAVYGEAFRPDTGLAAALAAAAALRILRTPLSQLAVAVGRTGDPARANVLRALALGPALLAAAAGFPIAAVAAAAALGEAAATWRAFALAAPSLTSPRPNEVPA